MNAISNIKQPIQRPPLIEVRCLNCGRLVCRANGNVEVKCPKCSSIVRK